MGYYAYGSGVISVRSDFPDDALADCINNTFSDSDYDRERHELYLSNDDKYYHDEVMDCLRAIAPYATGGEIEFHGEDETFWRFVIKDGKVREDYGRIVYDGDPAVYLSKNDQQFMIYEIVNSVCGAYGIVARSNQAFKKATDGVMEVLKFKSIL